MSQRSEKNDLLALVRMALCYSNPLLQLEVAVYPLRSITQGKEKPLKPRENGRWIAQKGPY